ncbi:MAG: SDR family NAD(P)-dependent oxidoreductase [Burkholderiaceae bacterium]
MNQIDLKNRHAIVTGGGTGIGLAVAQRLAVSGARVSIWDLTDADEAAAALPAVEQGPHQAIRLDVCDDAAVAQAAEKVDADFGRIDILVCSAGITGPNLKTWEYRSEDWRKVFEVNVHGTFLCNQAVILRMLPNDYGRIVNIASIAGKEGNPNAPAYSASKAAVIGLTKSIGKEAANTGIRVNCVTPAAVRTAIFDQMTEEHIQFMLSKIPLGRFGGVDEMGAMIAWLCSAECSFSTGAVFDLSGGRAVY